TGATWPPIVQLRAGTIPSPTIITAVRNYGEVGVANFPLLSEEGWAARSRKRREASLARADGVVFNLNRILLELDHHPVRSIKEASRHFVEVASTPPRRGGVSSLSVLEEVWRESKGIKPKQNQE